MSRPQNKISLLDLSQKNFESLMEFIAALPKETKINEFPPGTLNRNIRDVLMHLHQWHLMLLEWYAVGMQGKKPDMPAKGYSWKTTPELNQWIWKKYQRTTLDEAKEYLHASHRDITKIIEQHSNEELFTKQRYAWTGTTSLGAYLVSATSSHYDWALKLIKKATK